MLVIMECDLCTEQFDGAERVPKVLPCGHTACLQCLRRLPDCSCPTCRRDFNGPSEGLPTNLTVLKFLEGRRLDSAAAPGPPGPVPRRSGPSALTLLMGESWEVSLRGGGRELTGTLQNTEDPLMKALWLLLAEMAALTEDRAATRRDPPPAAAPSPSAAAPTQGPPSASAPAPSATAPAPSATATAPSAAAPAPSATAPAPSAAALTPIQGPPPAGVKRTREMDVGDISWIRPNGMKREKAAALEEALGVTRLVDVRCQRDPAWSLELLRRAAPSLEQLSVHYPSKEHLRAVHAMPRLRRLHVTSSPDPWAPALTSPGHAGLKWLSVWGLPPHILESMLTAHAASLEEVQLSVGASAKAQGYCYPYGDSEVELRSLFKRSNLRAMRKLVLKRRFVHHYAEDCVQQRALVRRHLDGAEVLCDQCDGVVAEEF